MQLDNFLSEISREYPNGRFTHPIGETGSMVMYWVRKSLTRNVDSDLWVAAEYLKTLNKKIGSNYSLRDINELNIEKNKKILDRIYNW